MISEIREQSQKALGKAGFIAELGAENVAATLEEAIQRYR